MATAILLLLTSHHLGGAVLLSCFGPYRHPNGQREVGFGPVLHFSDGHPIKLFVISQIPNYEVGSGDCSNPEQDEEGDDG